MGRESGRMLAIEIAYVSSKHGRLSPGSAQVLSWPSGPGCPGQYVSLPFLAMGP